MKPWQLAAKRSLDVIVAGAALVATSPVVGAAALAVRLTMGSPVMFRQQRPGLHGVPFEMVKLRTMLSESQAGTADDAARLTRLGLWLRATSVDELPSLWNVLRGDMSLVGPRPLLVQYLPLYSAEQARRHEVRPGLTGLAQVQGRNALGWDEKLALDVEYIERASLAMDLRILCQTVSAVLRRTGISHAGEATMSFFTGSDASGRPSPG